MAIPLFLAELTVTCGALLILPYLLYYSYIKGHFRTPQPRATTLEQDTRVSILICTLNEVKSVERKFEDILRQSYPLAFAEVLAVDGGSNDGTVEILRRIQERLHPQLIVRVIEKGAFRGKAAQINQGFRAATSEIVVTTDADVAMHEKAIEILVDSISINGVGAVCARQVLMNPDETAVTETERVYRGFYQTLRVGESNLHSTPIFHGGLSAYRKQAVTAIAEDVNADDAQLALSAIRNGFRALYEPHSVFYAESPSTLHDTWRQRTRRGQGLQRVLWRNGDMMLSRRFGVFGFPIFAAEFYMHLVSPFLFVATIISLAALLVMALLPFLAFVIPVCVGLVVFFYWKRRWLPIVFASSFVLYQAALFWAAILHLLGYNYKRWSTRK